MATGIVKWFDPKKGFGFVVNDDGKDVFIHYTSIDGEGFRCLKNGETVEYDQLDSDKGLQGRNVRIADIMPKSKPVEVQVES
jgi:CspA family cold shock protein